MISLSSTAVLDSKVIEGVRITCRRFGVPRRQAVDIQLAEQREKLRPIAAEIAENWPVRDEVNDKGEVVLKGDSPEVLVEKFKRRLVLEPQYEATEAAFVKPVFLRTYVDRIEGVEIDGHPMTVDEMPDELANEAFAFIKANNGLTPDERKNSQSPSTSQQAEGTAIPSSTAPAAENPAP